MYSENWSHKVSASDGKLLHFLALICTSQVQTSASDPSENPNNGRIVKQTPLPPSRLPEWCIRCYKASDIRLNIVERARLYFRSTCWMAHFNIAWYTVQPFVCFRPRPHVHVYVRKFLGAFRPLRPHLNDVFEKRPPEWINLLSHSNTRLSTPVWTAQLVNAYVYACSFNISW